MRVSLAVLLGLFLAAPSFGADPQKEKALVPLADQTLSESAQTPVELAEAIRDVIQGKIVTDVGAGDGRLMIAFSKYAKEVKGVEIDEHWTRACRAKGLNVVQGDATKAPPPRADVYYFWLHGLREIMPHLKCGIYVFGPYLPTWDAGAVVADYERRFPSEKRSVRTAAGGLFTVTIVKQPCE